MLDREVFSCIPFQLVFVPNLLVLVFCEKKVFPCLQKLFLELKLEFCSQNSFCEQLVLYTGFICSATSVRSIFLTVSSSSDPFTPIQLVFCFYRMYVTAYLLCTHRIVTFCYVDVRKHVRKHFWEKRSSVKYSGELWCRFLNESIPGFYDVVANVIIVITLWLRTFWQCSHFLKLMP